MKLHIGVGAAVIGLAISACGSSNGGTSSATSTSTGTAAGSSTGTAAGATSSGSAAGSVAGSSSGTTTGGTTTGPATTNGGTTTGPSWTVSTFVSTTPGTSACAALGADSAFAPQFLGVDSNANIYVTSADGDVDKITPAMALSVLTTITGNSPNGFCVDPTGGAFFSQNISFGEHTQIDSIATSSVIFDQPPSCTDGTVGAGGVGLGSVAGIAVDSSGNIYVADVNCYKVRMLSFDGTTITTVSGTGTQGLKNGSGDVAQFEQLSGIAIDSNGNLYVSESDIGDIREIQPDGTTSSLTGQANSLGGMAVGPDGTVYFSDSQLDYIKQIDPNTHATTTIAGSGVAGLVNGPGKKAKFDSPAGVGVDPNTGNVFVSDTSNCAIRMLTPPSTP